jgi:hypothetical protein
MKVLITLLATCLFSLSAMAVDATHGMVLFGKDKVYAYHLPMFHKVHNKQMVLTFDLSKAVKDQIVNLQDTTFLTFVPAPFDLEKFIAAPFDLTGEVYSGHFEQDGVLVMSGVTLVNPKIEYVEDLIQPNGSTIESYKVFGTKNDTYALHLIDGGKAIDQIFKLTTLHTGNFDYAISYKDLNVSALNIGESYSISTPPGECPSRNCGNPGQDLATFKVDSLYFSDSVMGASMPVMKNAGLQATFCKTRLCEFPTPPPVVKEKVCHYTRAGECYYL